MNRYRIRYRKGHSGIPRVRADRVCGFKSSCDTYQFKRDGEIVAAIPKDVVASIELMGSGSG